MNPPSLLRLRLWIEAATVVRGRRERYFIKLHCHGMNPRDEFAMLGEAILRFLEKLTRWARESHAILHFLTARQMVNVAVAACDGCEGSPLKSRNYRFRLNEVPVRS